MRGVGGAVSPVHQSFSLSLSCTNANLVSLSAAFISCRRLRNESLPFLFSVQCSGHPKTPRWAQTAPCDRSPVLAEESSAILSASLRGDHFTTLQTRALPRKCCIFFSFWLDVAAVELLNLHGSLGIVTIPKKSNISLT